VGEVETRMPKRDKEARKRAERRERAKERTGEDLSTGAMVDLSDTAAAQALPAPSSTPPARERKADKAVEEEPPLTFKEQVEEFFGPMTDFLKEVNIERKKISWPTRDEAWHSTWVVVFAIVFLATFMGVFSYGAQIVAKRLFSVEAVNQNPMSAPAQPTSGGTLPGTTPPTGSTPPPTGSTGAPAPSAPAPTPAPSGGGAPAGGQ
jgi:preprotein translocase SecE subunit